MVHVGTAGQPPGSRGPVDALRRLEAAGLDAMEVQFVRQVSMPLDRARETGEEAARLGIRLSAHAPYYINFNSDKEGVRQRSVAWAFETLRRTDAMGAAVAVVHAASYGNRPEDATAAVVDGLGEVRSLMDEAGVEALIGLETMGKKGSWGTMDEISAVCGRVEGTVPVLDFAHLHARSGGALRSEDDFLSLIEASRDISGRDPHCHCSGVEYGEKGERRHLPLESQEPDYRLLASLSRELGDDAVLIVESPRPLDDAIMLKGAMGM